MNVIRGKETAPFFVAWDEFGTRYRLFAMPLVGFEPSVREEIGTNSTGVLVTLWLGKSGVSAVFNAGGESPLVDHYIGERLSIDGEDLQAVAPKLRAMLLRRES